MRLSVEGCFHFTRVACIYLVGLAVWEALMQVGAVQREHTGIVISGDDLHRSLNRG